jgi:hypothetical protein
MLLYFATKNRHCQFVAALGAAGAPTALEPHIIIGHASEQGWMDWPSADEGGKS